MGDKVLVPNGNYTFVGVVVQTVPGATSCNLYVTPLANTQLTNANACLHVEDIDRATIPDLTAKAAPPVDNAHVAEGCEKFTTPTTAA